MNQPHAFTIGNKKGYDKALRETPDTVLKLGRQEGYEGGCCWRTRAEAEAYLDVRGRHVDFGRGRVECEVYGLLLPHGWDQNVDIEHPDPEGFHRLLTDVPIVVKEYAHGTKQ